MPEPAGRSLRFALYAGAALLLVTGCSDEPVKPGTVPTTTTTASPSSPSESPSSLTPEQEVEAAVRAYYAELTRAAQTNDTSKLKTMVSTGCPCYEPIRTIERGARRGEITPDAVWTIRLLRVHDVTSGSALAEVKYDVSSYEVLDESGEVLGEVKGQTSHYDLSLVKLPRGWIIGNLIDLDN